VEENVGDSGKRSELGVRDEPDRWGLPVGEKKKKKERKEREEGVRG
jgi:hypothetical protein